MILITLELTDKLIDLYEGAVKEIEGKGMDYAEAKSYCDDEDIDAGICYTSLSIFNSKIHNCDLMEKFIINEGYISTPAMYTYCMPDLINSLTTRIKVLHEIKQQLT